MEQKDKTEILNPSLEISQTQKTEAKVSEKLIQQEYLEIEKEDQRKEFDIHSNDSCSESEGPVPTLAMLKNAVAKIPKLSERDQFKKFGIEKRFLEMQKIFENNRVWSQTMIDRDPNYFIRLKDIQEPDYLWIGCSDSRVPANEIVGLAPGEIFVHRNIGNLIISSDLNLISVVEFAVSILKVKHIIVCGHFGCSGVKYAYHSADAGMLNPWITNIKDHYRHHRHELDKIKDEKERINKFVEYNVIEGCLTLMKMYTIQKSFAQNRFPIVHACVYDLSNGKLIDLNIDFIDKMAKLGSIYSYKFEETK